VKRMCSSQTSYIKLTIVMLFVLTIIGCEKKIPINPNALKPVVVTEPAAHDTDDPAIWINPEDPSKSLIIGTDKDVDGALYVYDLSGKIVKDKVVKNIKRPNNVDLEYGLLLNGQAVDIAVTTERFENRLRVFSVPDMKPVDNGGIPVFEGEALRAPMGVSLYKRATDGAIYAIVGRKEGPTDGTYLWQYLLEDDGQGTVKGTLVRKFGTWSGVKEIEAIAVDNQLGYVYCSDEHVGVRKYHADPDISDANKELGMFCLEGIAVDREGISIYNLDDSTGYILVSDQQANEFHVFPREGEVDNPHQHSLLKVVPVSTNSSDGSDVTSITLNENFPGGLFVAMSEGMVFHYYAWKDIAGDDLKIRK